jgi:hypothetical protein
MGECERVAGVLNVRSLLSNSWKIADLNQPDIFLDAVLAAMWSDVIVISTRATEEPPVDLCVWVDAWLPRRHRGPGALMALVGAMTESRVTPCKVGEYLWAVARRAGLDPLGRQFRPPQRAPAFAYMHPTAEQACPMTQTLSQMLQTAYARR